MASGTITLSNSASSGSYLAGKVVWSSVSNAAGNYSDVTATVYAKKCHTSTVLTVATVGDWSWSLSIGGNSYTGTAYKSILTDWVSLGSKTVRITHADSGAKSVAITAAASAPAGTSWAGHKSSGGGTAVLDTIARASVPTVNYASANMGDTIAIYTNAVSSAFTHTVRYTFGSASGTIATGVTSGCTWTIPQKLAEQIPNALSGKGSIYCDTYSGSTKIGTASVSFTAQVHYSTAPSLSSYRAAMGSLLTISTPRAASSFTHTLSYSFAGTTGTIATGVAASCVWTIPLELAKLIPSAVQGSMNITCTTYNGSAKVGSISVTLTVTVPNQASTQPSFTVSCVPVADLDSAFDGLYIRGRTRLKTSFTASSTYSAIASCRMTVEGKSYYGNPAISAELTVSGDQTVKFQVTDARGYYKTAEQTITILAYDPPKAVPYTGEKSVICERCLSDGTASPVGTYLRIRAGRAYSILSGKNACTLSYAYKLTSAEDYSDWTVLLDAASDASETDVILPDVVPLVTASYDIRIRAADTLGCETCLDFHIPTDAVTLHLRAGGKGAAFGKYAEADGLLDIAPDWDLRLKGSSIADFVTEEGTSGDWYYRRWYSGRAECWASVSVTAAASTVWGSLYYAAVDAKEFPFRFASAPGCCCTATGAPVFPAAAATQDQAPAVRLLSAASGSLTAVVSYYAAGMIET